VSHNFGATLKSCSNITYWRNVQASGAHSDKRQCYRKNIDIRKKRHKVMQRKWKKPLPQLRLCISLWHLISSSIATNIQDLAETLRNPLPRIGVFCRTFFIYHSHTTGPSQSIFTILSSYFIRQIATKKWTDVWSSVQWR